MAIKKSFKISSQITSFNNIEALLVYLDIRKSDLIVTERRVVDNYLRQLLLSYDYNIVYKDDFIEGHNNYAQFTKLRQSLSCNYDRVIAFGGGTTLDVAKLLAIDNSNIKALFFENIEPKRLCKLILVPTTPGTGSEVTPYCALYFEDRGLQLLLSSNRLFADEAILCPKLLEKIPFEALLASAFDAFVHAFESYLSPLATFQSNLLSLKAIEDLVLCFMQIANKGISEVEHNLPKIQQAGNLAGISYANAGCAAVHALAYPLSSRLGIHHGEANYLVFFDVLDIYLRKKPDGKIVILQNLIAKTLCCEVDQAFAELNTLCDYFIPRKRLSEYGMKENQILEFTDMVLSRQHLLISNGYENLSAFEIQDIYQNIL